MTGFGYFVFGDLPDIWTLTGASVVIASGIYLVHRENATRQQKRSAAATEPLRI